MGLPLAKPERIGRYEIISVIGRGGMGTVYLATDPRIGRSVAIKVLASSLGHDPELLARFYREAKSTGGLQHQNIVTVYELGDQEGFPYLVMEYLEGDSLDATIVAHKPLPVAEKLDILIQVCSGLNYAHKRGIVHRDIKPANIVMVKGGTAKIVDFGIAQVGTSRLTRTGMVVGSIHYMSPEQLSGKVDVDPRTDLYSAGVVLFQLLTGVLPFEGRDTSSTLLKIIHDPPPSVGKFLNDCPAELESIIQKALAKNRDERYASADDFAFELTRLQQQLSRGMLTEYLAEAARAIEQQQFDEAKRLLMQVLRADSQNVRAKELLRDVQWKLEVQKRRQQVHRLLQQAKEAFGNRQFDAALENIDDGLNLDTANSELRALRAAILKTREDDARFSDLLKRAEFACQHGDLAAASGTIGEARAIRPNDLSAQALQSRIARLLEERKRQEKAAEAEQFALVVSGVEKAIADARRLLLLQEDQRAFEILEKAAGQPGITIELKAQIERIKGEIRERSVEPQDRKTDRDSGSRDSRSIDSSSPWEETIGTSRSESATEFLSAASYPQPLPANGPAYPREVATHREEADSGQLLEFLPERSSIWSRGTFWIGLAVAIVALVGGWLVFGPKGNSAVQATYVEINAEPWGTVKEIVSAAGQSVSRPEEQTPLRLALPRGRYTVTLSGPNGEEKQLQLEVPGREGNSYFVLFSKPDIDRILSAQ